MLLSLLGNDQKGNELDLEEIAAMSPEIVAASTESLKSYFMCVFAIADENQDGVLSKSEGCLCGIFKQTQQWLGPQGIESHHC